MKKLLFALVVLCSFAALKAVREKCFCHNCRSCHANNGKVVCNEPDKEPIGCCQGQASNNVDCLQSKCCKRLKNLDHNTSWSDLMKNEPAQSPCPKK